MQNLNGYKLFYSLLKEQENKEPAPDWFKLFTSAKSTQGKKLTLNQNQIQTFWDEVLKLQKQSNKKFTNAKELQEYLWNTGGENLQKKLTDYRLKIGIKNPPKKELFCDGKLGGQTFFAITSLTKNAEMSNLLSPVEGSKEEPKKSDATQQKEVTYTRDNGKEAKGEIKSVNAEEKTVQIEAPSGATFQKDFKDLKMATDELKALAETQPKEEENKTKDSEYPKEIGWDFG